MAVLGAAPRLGREDPLHLDLGSAPGQAHLVGERGQCRHRLVGDHGQCPQFLGPEGAMVVEQGLGGGGDELPCRAPIGRSRERCV